MLQQTNTTRAIPNYLNIIVLFIIALGIRTFLWNRYPHVIFLHEADAMGYISIARNIIENFSINNSTHFPPFYPAVIAVSSLLTSNYESGARFSSIALGAGMVIPYFLACSSLMSTRAAFCAGLLVACFAPFVDYSLQPISQATYMWLVACGIWVGIGCIKRHDRTSLILFGLISAAVYLTRPEGILFFAINLPILAYVIFKEQSHITIRLKSLGLLLSSFFLPFFWYVACIKHYTGHWSISGKSGITSIGIDASMKLMPNGKTYGEMAAGKAGLMDLIPTFSSFVATYISQLGKFAAVVSASLPVTLFALAAIGLLHTAYKLFSDFHQTRNMQTFLLYGMIVTPLVMLLPVMAFDKISVATGYVLPFYLVLFFFCAQGVVWLEELIVENLGKVFPPFLHISRYISFAVVVSVILAWNIFLPLHQWISSNQFEFMRYQQNFLLRTTGQWFISHSNKSAKIMARWSNIGYYGDRNWVGLADGTVSEVTEFARRQGITHIVIDSDAVPRRRPQLASLLTPSYSNPGLTPVYAEEQFDTRVIIYRVD